jgi:CheY-like chemotaxis protein
MPTRPGDRNVGDRPGRHAPRTPIVDADEPGRRSGRNFGDQCEHWLAALPHPVERVENGGMVGDDHAERVDRLREPVDLLGDGLGIDLAQVDDRGPRLDGLAILRRLVQSPRESLVKRPLLLQQHEPQGRFASIDFQTLTDRASRVKTNALGRRQHALGGIAAHARAAVQHAIDCGDADAGRQRQVGDGRTLHDSFFQNSRRNKLARSER